MNDKNKSLTEKYKSLREKYSPCKKEIKIKVLFVAESPPKPKKEKLPLIFTTKIRKRTDFGDILTRFSITAK